MIEEVEFHYGHGKEIFIFPEVFQPALRLTQSPAGWIL
jgi:hypothetical protein